MENNKVFLCISCDFKASDFMIALKELGHKVYLVTSEKTKNDAWPHHAIEEIFYMPGNDGRNWNIDHLEKGVAYIYRKNYIDKIIALDDYDVWKAASLREQFRSPGMGQTTARHFFDKLSMRMIAKENNINVPDFSHLFNDDKINAFFERSRGPWVVKPRSDAGSLGIRKIHSPEDFWKWNEEHVENRHHFLIEEFKPGDVYHVDALFNNCQSLFTRASKYLQPPFEVAHGGGVFRSQTCPVDSSENKDLKLFNDQLLKAFKLNSGASHSEFIKCHEDGKYYFLETSARVGGAHLADMVHAASGINLWKEWAALESSILCGTKYKLPQPEKNNSGIVATLSRFEYPDYSQFNDPAIWWTMQKKYHIGMIFKDKSNKVIKEKLDHYTDRIFNEFHTSVPLKE
jgi:biotin carboxylase